MEQQIPVTKEELKGFYSFPVATEGYSVMAIAVFLPVILKTLAADQAYDRDGHVSKCDTSTDYKCDVKVLGFWIDTSSLVLVSASISVFFQLILFSTLGSLADYGPERKRFMINFALLAALTGFCIVFVVNSSLFLWAYLIYILGGVFYGAAYVFDYSWLPVLTRSMPEVLAANNDPNLSESERNQVADQVGNEISSKAFYYGYVTALVQLVMAAVLVVLVGDGTKWGLPENYPMQICIGMLSIWQAGILLGYTNQLMKKRPGPPLPDGENYISFSLKNLMKTLRHANRLPELFKCLLAWFFYSDAFTTMSGISVLFAQSELSAGTPLILACAVLFPLSAGVGSIAWLRLQNKFGWTTRQMLIIHSLLYALLPIYGLAGFLVKRGTFFGMQNALELPIVTFFHGFLIGATQSSCRVLFSQLLPQGQEAKFFGLYGITDKGSTWLGPLIVGYITNATGSLRWSFMFLLFQFLVPSVLFYSINLSKGQQEAIEFVDKLEPIQYKPENEI